ncbi:hypothetical protein GRF29_19g2744316 [Pseudopithomyces chartarum]|uniref:Uncharacterized protein n=1 Tax=Pseudopithomyces chartarum TaxID=1892770 RepID=A0AAN6M6N5_9PLEO|nr:hypothetical protein GRF29_19g2744316 [Pseudopithomyces chartarum]
MQQRERIEKVFSETNDEPTQIDRIAEIRGWFRPEKNSIFYPAVQNYVNDETDLQTTVTQITKPIDEAIAAQKFENTGQEDLWNSILHSAKRIPYQQNGHKKLLDLIKAIQKCPEPSLSEEQSMYTTLSSLGRQVREVYNDSPGDIGKFPPEIHAWTNCNYFLALLNNSEILNLHIYVIWAMREALEEKADPPKEWYDTHVPAAAVWVFVLGRKLYEREEDLTPKSEYEGNPARGGELWTGGSEFSKARWAFWKKRFGEVAGEEGVSQETKDIAKEAVAAMEKAESA